jgi:hypothetical protein
MLAGMLTSFLALALAVAAGQLELGVFERANFFNSFWTDGKSNVNYKNLANGQFTVTWDKGGNFVGGKGWNPGSTSKYATSPVWQCLINYYFFWTEGLFPGKVNLNLKATPI